MTDKGGAAYIVHAVPDDSGNRLPTLALICQEGHFKGIDYFADAWLAVDSADGDSAETRIEYRTDQNRVHVELWMQGADFRHLVSSSVGLKELLGAQSLIIRVNTLEGDVLTDEFNVGRLKGEMFQVDCGR